MANIEKLISKGINYWQSNELVQAKKTFEKVISLKPNFYEIKSYLGIIELKLGSHEKGICLLKSASKFAPKDTNIKKNLSNALLEYANYLISRLNYVEAFNILKEAISVEPSNINFYINFLKLANQTKNFKDVDQIYSEAIKISDRNIDLFYIYANSLLDQKKYDLALKVYQKALELKSDFSECLFHQALCYEFLGNKDLAFEKYDEALAIKPDYFLAIHNKALLLLAQENFHDGWCLYLNRWKKNNNVKDYLITARAELVEIPKNNEYIYIWSEQGIGDQVLFSSMLNDFKKFTKNLIVSLDERLIPIYARSFENINFISKNTDPKKIEFSRHVPLGNLGLFVRKDISDFKNQQDRFLYPNLQLKDRFAKEYKKNNRKLVGISWTSINNKYAESKSINLDQFNKIFKKNHFDFVNLQYINSIEEISLVKKKYNVNFYEANDIDKFNDLDSLLTLISACDFVITISNVTAHFAGAMGIKTFLLAPYGYGKMWYWAQEGKSKWYPSLTVIHQKKIHGWDDVFEKLAAYLET